MTQYTIPTYLRQRCPRYEANEEDAIDQAFDILEEAGVDDPSDTKLRSAVIEGINRSIEDLRKYLIENKDKLIEEIRDAFNECLEEE